MFISILYIILAVLGLSFLIFIHELGHYWMAKRVGMRVETFAIGFGKPIYSWKRDGVDWQIGWLLFGGYVKIAGADLDSDKNPYEITDGFFGKSPWDRIKVAFMGPLTNLAFALLIFAALWMSGGREKNFSEFTSVIGWVDPASELYSNGIRPGDEVTAYDNQPFHGSKDHLYMPMTATSDKITVQGNKVDYATGEKTPFSYDVKVYPHPAALEKGITTTGITQSASYIIYNRLANGQENPLPEGSPLIDSGIEYGDRIVWAGGEPIYSLQQLNKLLKGDGALLTIQRGSNTLLRRVPRIQMQELKPDAQFREEVIDWQFAAKLNNLKTQSLYIIPYNITNDNVVENELRFIDKEKQDTATPAHPYSSIEQPLEPGDKIIAINGTPIQQASELLSQLQTYRLNIIVSKNPQDFTKISWTNADAEFTKQVDWKSLQQITNSIGTADTIKKSGNLFLLNTVTPKLRSQLALPTETQALMASELQEQKNQIEKIDDPEKKHHAQKLLDQQEKHLMIGLPSIQDRKVNYNPSAFTLFNNVVEEIWHMLKALFSGTFNPKWMSGPIGIVQMVHDTSMSNIKEALYWLGAISLNLGIINLLPIPVLDGGTIAVSLFEIISGKRVHPKTLEKVIIPFAVLLIGFFIFLTYNDVMRIFSHFW